MPRLPRSNWRGGGSLGQRVVRALFVAGATLATGLISIAFATPASAHASLLKTSPAADSVVRVAPKQVLLTFGESVYVGGDAVQVYDDHLHRVDTGAAGHLTNQGPTVGVALRPALPDGTYTVTWRVTSADTHVVSGGFVFSVGAPSRVIGKVPGLAANHAAAVLLGVSRGVGYAGLIAGPGLLVALYAIWPAGLRERRVLRIARAGGVTILLSATVDLFLQGVYAQGLPLSQMFSNAALSGTHGGRFGTAHLIRQNLALPYCILLRARWAKRLFSPASTSRVWRLVSAGIAAALGIALALTWSTEAHASVGSLAWLATSLDTAHIAAMAVWLGGLLALAVSVRTVATGSDWAVGRFSRLAGGCVAVIVGTGLYATWREVGTPPALIHTTYGYLLLIKVLLVVALIAVASRSRAWVGRHQRVPAAQSLPTLAGDCAQRVEAQPSARSIHRLRRSLAAELAFGVCVLAATAALTGTVQARLSYAPSYSSTQSLGSHQVRLTVDRAHTGTATIRVVVSMDGHPVTVPSVTGSLSLPAESLGPLPLQFTPSSGQAAQAAAIFSVPGAWDVDVLVRFDAIRATSFRFPLHVR